MKTKHTEVHASLEKNILRGKRDESPSAKALVTEREFPWCDIRVAVGCDKA